MVDWLVYNRYADNRGDLAARMGYTPTVLSAALTGRIPFSEKLARNLCQYNKRLNLDWLLHEVGEMLIPEAARTGNPEGTRTVILEGTGNPEGAAMSGRTIGGGISSPSVPKGAKMVPFYRDLLVSAGQTDMFEYNEAHDHIYIPGVDADAFFPVVGMSMQPNIMPGDTIGVKQLHSLERIDPTRVYMIITRQNERMIKHIMPSRPEDEEVTLTSDNSDFSAFTVRKEDILKVMRVVYVGRMM